MLSQGKYVRCRLLLVDWEWQSCLDALSTLIFHCGCE